MFVKQSDRDGNSHYSRTCLTWKRITKKNSVDQKEAHLWNAVILNYNICENNNSKIRNVRFV